VSVLGRNVPLQAFFAAFLALIFSLAPLICIHFCELHHWSLASQAVLSPPDAHAGMTRHGHVAHHEQQPASHKPPLSEFGDALRAIVELLPIAALPAVTVVSRLTRFATMLPPLACGSALQSPPPRTSRVTAFA
jgi:hypothetical protein